MTDNRPVTIYISASPTLMAAREALARMIAELPVTLAWHIVQTADLFFFTSQSIYN
jgi:hypothetical protein